MIITKEATEAALALQNRENVAKFFSIEFLEQKGKYFLFNCVFPEEARNPLAFVQGGFTSWTLDDVTAVTVSMFTSGTKLPN